MSQAFQQSLPQMLAAFRENGAPNPTRQFQRGLLHNQRAVDLYIEFDCVSFVVFSRQSDCALISFYLFVCWYSRGSSCFSATRPGVVGTILVRLFIGTVDQQPDLGAFFVVGPGYTPVLGKLVAKITSGAFVELADLLAENIGAQEAEALSAIKAHLSHNASQ